MAWTKKQLTKALRADGYKNIGHGAYHNSNTDHTLKLYDWVNGGEAWRQWADNERLPLPPVVVANYTDPWWQISILYGESGRLIRFDKLPHKLNGEAGERLARAILKGLSDEV